MAGWAAPYFKLQAGQEQEGPPGPTGPCASPKVAPSPEGLGSPIPTPPTPLTAGLAPSAVTPLPTGCLSWSGVILMP